MAGLFRPQLPFLQTNAWQNAQVNALRYNTAQAGSVVPIIYGQIRQQTQLINFANYEGPGGGSKGKFGPLPVGGQSVAGSGGGKSGKKGGKKSGDYFVDVDWLLCEGPVNIGPTNFVYVSASVAFFQSVGANLYLGDPAQPVDPTFDSLGFPVNYSNSCHVTVTPLDMGSSPVIPNVGFEVTGFFTGRNSGPQYPLDCNPADAITDFLTNTRYGAGLLVSNLSLSDYLTYCQAAQLVISTALDGQQKAADWLQALTRLTNSEVVCTGSVIKVVSYGDVALVNSNGTSWYPNLNPVYSFTDDDFLPWHPSDLGRGPDPNAEDPIEITRTNPIDAQNWVSIEYMDRDNFYNPTIVAVFDQGAIDAYGLHASEHIQGKAFTNAITAQISAQLRLQRLQYIRNTYKFKVGWQYCLLEPMDIVLLSETISGLVQTPARITAIEEDENGDLTFEAEDFPVGANAPAPTPPSFPALYDAGSNGRIIVEKDPPIPPYGGPKIVQNVGFTQPITTSYSNDFVIVACFSEVPDYAYQGVIWPYAHVGSVSGAGIAFSKLYSKEWLVADSPGAPYSCKVVVDLWGGFANSTLVNQTFTVSYDSLVRSATFGVVAAHGIDVNNPIDGGIIDGAVPNTTGGPMTLTGSITTTYPNDLLLGFFCNFMNPVLAYASSISWNFIKSNPWPNSVNGLGSPGLADAVINVAGSNLLGVWNNLGGEYLEVSSAGTYSVEWGPPYSLGEWVGVGLALRGGGHV